MNPINNWINTTHVRYHFSNNKENKFLDHIGQQTVVWKKTH